MPSGNASKLPERKGNKQPKFVYTGNFGVAQNQPCTQAASEPRAEFEPPDSATWGCLPYTAKVLPPRRRLDITGYPRPNSASGQKALTKGSGHGGPSGE